MKFLFVAFLAEDFGVAGGNGLQQGSQVYSKYIVVHRWKTWCYVTFQTHLSNILWNGEIENNLRTKSKCMAFY